jgi:hypothetical protein
VAGQLSLEVVEDGLGQAVGPAVRRHHVRRHRTDQHPHAWQDPYRRTTRFEVKRTNDPEFGVTS